MPEYECSPIWISRNDSIYENISVGSLNRIPEELIIKIDKWNDLYQATLDQDYPPDSGFKSLEEEGAFERQGLEIWKEIHKFYDDTYKVIYYSIKNNKLLESLTDN